MPLLPTLRRIGRVIIPIETGTKPTKNPIIKRLNNVSMLALGVLRATSYA